MRKSRSLVFILGLLFALVVRAQDMVPATSEDIDQFDRQLARQLENSRGPKERAKKPADQKAQPNERFGQMVSDEAKKLKDADGDKKKDFGKWVSGQRRKDDDGRPGADGSTASHGASGKDSSEPGSDVRGSAPGNSGNSGRGKGNGNTKK